MGRSRDEGPYDPDERFQAEAATNAVMAAAPRPSLDDLADSLKAARLVAQVASQERAVLVRLLHEADRLYERAEHDLDEARSAFRAALDRIEQLP